MLIHSHTFLCFTFPDEIRAWFVCRCQQLPLCILSCDVLEKPAAKNMKKHSFIKVDSTHYTNHTLVGYIVGFYIAFL